MRDLQRLAVVIGGQSTEHEVSVSSGQSVLREADAERFEVVPFGVTQNGAWLTPDETRARLEQVTAGERGDIGDDDGIGILGYPKVLTALGEMDVVFPIVHGTFGEDGTLQGLFELADLPYVGSGVGASAVGMDKELMRSVLAAAGIPQPAYIVLTDDEVREPPEEAIRFVESELGYPCFVKPCNGGSSVGVSKAASREDFHEAVASAARHDRKVIVEAAMVGHEVECAVLGNDAPAASGVAEIVTSGEFYTYEAKYLDDTAQLVVPASIHEVTRERVRELSLRVFRAVNCAGLARVDFFADDDGGEPQVIEINTLPGFTPISMFPRLWQEEGLSYSELISRLVDLALERHTERSQRELRWEAS
jgi:D-alanine-D-alanine ligase